MSEKTNKTNIKRIELIALTKGLFLKEQLLYDSPLEYGRVWAGLFEDNAGRQIRMDIWEDKLNKMTEQEIVNAISREHFYYLCKTLIWCA